MQMYFGKMIIAKKTKFAIFDATVVASLDEQDKQYKENWEGIKLKSVPILQSEIPIEIEDRN